MVIFHSYFKLPESKSHHLPMLSEKPSVSRTLTWPFQTLTLSAGSSNYSLGDVFQEPSLSKTQGEVVLSAEWPTFYGGDDLNHLKLLRPTGALWSF